jgi:hypothetical protein
MQATGPPESAGVCGDATTNWSPLGSTTDPEWLELYYSVPLPAIGVDVHESLEQHFVYRIEVRDPSGHYDIVRNGPDDPLLRPAAEVSGLGVAKLAAGALRLSWDPSLGAETYAILRGELSTLSATNLGDCQIDGWTALAWNDSEIPPPLHGFTYLVRGDSAACGPGTLGFGAFGVKRFDSGGVCAH